MKPRYTPNIAAMNFVLKYNHIDYLIPLDAPENLWTHENFNPDWPLVLFVTGWTANYDVLAADNVALNTLYEAYHCRGGINFVVSNCLLLRMVFLNLEFLFIFLIFLCRRSTVPRTLIPCTHGLPSIRKRLAKKSVKLLKFSFERIQ